MYERISPLYFQASKAKLAICIIAACLDLPVYMVLVSKRLLPSGHSVPDRSVSGDIALNFSQTPLSDKLHIGGITQPYGFMDPKYSIKAHRQTDRRQFFL